MGEQQQLLLRALARALLMLQAWLVGQRQQPAAHSAPALVLRRALGVTPPSLPLLVLGPLLPLLPVPPQQTRQSCTSTLSRRTFKQVCLGIHSQVLGRQGMLLQGQQLQEQVEAAQMALQAAVVAAALVSHRCIKICERCWGYTPMGRTTGVGERKRPRTPCTTTCRNFPCLFGSGTNHWSLVSGVVPRRAP